MSTQNPTDLPSKKSDRQEYFHEVYAPNKSDQLHSILEDELERQRDRLGGAHQW